MQRSAAQAFGLVSDDEDDGPGVIYSSAHAPQNISSFVMQTMRPHEDGEHKLACECLLCLGERESGTIMVLITDDEKQRLKRRAEIAEAHKGMPRHTTVVSADGSIESPRGSTNTASPSPAAGVLTPAKQSRPTMTAAQVAFYKHGRYNKLDTKREPARAVRAAPLLQPRRVGG